MQGSAEGSQGWPRVLVWAGISRGPCQGVSWQARELICLSWPSGARAGEQAPQGGGCTRGRDGLRAAAQWLRVPAEQGRGPEQGQGGHVLWAALSGTKVFSQSQNPVATSAPTPHPWTPRLHQTQQEPQSPNLLFQ